MTGVDGFSLVARATGTVVAGASLARARRARLVGSVITARGDDVGSDHHADDHGHHDDRESQRSVGTIQLELIRHGSSGSRGFAPRKSTRGARRPVSGVSWYSMTYKRRP